MIIKARELVRAYHSSPAPTNDVFRKRIRAELWRNRRRVPEVISKSKTPWQFLVYVLVKGKLGRSFTRTEIAHMICPNRLDIDSARDRVDLALSKLGLSTD